MKPIVLLSCMLALMVSAFVGCSGSSSEEDKIYAEMEKINKDMMALQDKTKADPASAEKMMGEMMAFMGKIGELSKKIEALPKEKQEALKKRLEAAPWAKKK